MGVVPHFVLILRIGTPAAARPRHLRRGGPRAQDRPRLRGGRAALRQLGGQGQARRQHQRAATARHVTRGREAWAPAFATDMTLHGFCPCRGGQYWVYRAHAHKVHTRTHGLRLVYCSVLIRPPQASFIQGGKKAPMVSVYHGGRLQGSKRFLAKVVY